METSQSKPPKKIPCLSKPPSRTPEHDLAIFSPWLPRHWAAYVQGGDYVENPFVFKPTALHVCQNARQETLNFYKHLSESISANDDFEYDSEFECDSADDLPESTDDDQSQDSGSRMLRSRSIYFDPALDTIYLKAPFCQKRPLYVDFAEGFPGMNKMQSVAIDYYPGSHIIEELFHIILCSRGNLTEVLLAVGPGEFSWEDRPDGRSIKFVEPKDDTIWIAPAEMERHKGWLERTIQ